MADFDTRMRELSEQIGNGPLVGKCTVDQVYAEYQERREDLSHPNGGQAHYLEDSFFDTAQDNMQGIADELLERGPLPPMIDAVERISSQVARRAPVDLFYLRHSAHPTVTEDAALIYDRAPIQRRLTEQELRALAPQRRRPDRGD